MRGSVGQRRCGWSGRGGSGVGSPGRQWPALGSEGQPVRRPQGAARGVVGVAGPASPPVSPAAACPASAAPSPATGASTGTCARTTPPTVPSWRAASTCLRYGAASTRPRCGAASPRPRCGAAATRPRYGAAVTRLRYRAAVGAGGREQLHAGCRPEGLSRPGTVSGGIGWWSPLGGCTPKACPGTVWAEAVCAVCRVAGGVRCGQGLGRGAGVCWSPESP